MVSTVSPITWMGSASRASASARSSMRVRSIVGQNVTRVPVTVRPIQPSRLAVMCAMSRRPCHSSGRPNASATPNDSPTGRQMDAAT